MSQGDAEILPMFKADIGPGSDLTRQQGDGVSLIHVDDFAVASSGRPKRRAFPTYATKSMTAIRTVILDGAPIRIHGEDGLADCQNDPNSWRDVGSPGWERHRRVGGARTVLCLDRCRNSITRLGVQGRASRWQPRFALAFGFLDTVNWYRAKGCWIHAVNKKLPSASRQAIDSGPIVTIVIKVISPNGLN